MYTTGPRGRYYYSDVYYKENTLTAIVITRVYICNNSVYRNNVSSYVCVCVCARAPRRACVQCHIVCPLALFCYPQRYLFDTAVVAATTPSRAYKHTPSSTCFILYIVGLCCAIIKIIIYCRVAQIVRYNAQKWNTYILQGYYIYNRYIHYTRIILYCP